MKSKVLNRPLFKKKGPPIPPEEADNVGIMQGFMDQVDMMDDMEDEGDDDEMEMGKMMDRRPDSPEILMNNLRGDMRSVDARVEELADLVGYRAASETPTEVLALLQPVLAQQSMMAQPPAQMAGPVPAGPMPAPEGEMAAPAGGVADLAAMAQGPQTMPPMPMPEAPPPGGIGSLPAAAEQQAPISMKNGGIVQHFQGGSDEGGVTPVEDQPSYVNYPKDMIEQARAYLMDRRLGETLTVPDLGTEAALRAKQYEKLLGSGDSRQMTQAQMLFDIASGALNVAAGVDAEGRPIRGAISPVGRIAAGMRNVPAMIGARAGELQKQERALKMAGIESAEKRIQSVLEYNAKIIESNRKRFTDVLKNSGMSTLFGKGDWEWRVINTPGLLSDWAAGKTDPDQTQLIESAITKLQQPKIETRTDPVSKQPYTVNIPAVIPKFVEQAINAHGKLFKDRKGVSTTPVTTGGGGGGGAGAPSAFETGQAPTSGKGAGLFFKEATYIAKKGKEKVPYFYQTPSPDKPTFFNLAGKGTGVVNVGSAFIQRLPGIGPMFDFNEELYATDFITKTADRIINSLQVNKSYAVGEFERIKENLDVKPQLIDNEGAYKIRLRALDDTLIELANKAYELGYTDPKLDPEVIGKNMAKYAELMSIRQVLGVPPREAKVLQSKEQWDKSPKGSVWIVNGELLVK